MADTDGRSGVFQRDIGGSTKAERIDLAKERAFAIGELRFEPSTRQLFAAGGHETLEPRVMQVLALLAGRRGQVVSRDDLVQQCWKGRAVSEHAINRCIAKVRHVADVHGSFALETIPRVGYRLNEIKNLESGHRHRRVRMLAAVTLLLLIGAAVLWLTVFRPTPTTQQTASLAVLPFRSMSSNDEFLAEGVAEELLTLLSQHRGVRVVGRTSSWMFKDRATDLRHVGRQLGVSHILEGTVDRTGRHIRVHVALVDAGDGMRLWSQVFEGSLDDIFLIQRNIGDQVAKRLQTGPTGPAPLIDSVATTGDVYAMYMAARGLQRTRDIANIETSTQLLKRATRLDPEFAPAWSALAKSTYLGRWAQPVAARVEATTYADRALELAPDLADAHAVKGLLAADSRIGVRHLERAVQLQPNHAEAWLWLSTAYNTHFAFEKSLQAIRKCAEIDPFWLRCAQYSDAAWGMGERASSQRFDKWLIEHHPDAAQRELVRGKLAARRGDWSAYLNHQQRAANLDRGDTRSAALGNIALTRIWLGLPLVSHPSSPMGTLMRSVLRNELPPLDSILTVIGSPQNFWSLPLAIPATRLFLRKGRADELVWLYDQSFSSPDEFVGSSPVGEIRSVSFGPTIALALRKAGRHREAEQMLQRVDLRIEQAVKQPRVPTFDWAAFARIWAVQGKTEEAIKALERAFAAGWPNGEGPVYDRMPSLIPSDDPAFDGLRDDARFKRMDSAIRGHLEKERREVEKP